MAASVISRLEAVPLREVLPHEERDFTPWLEANLDVLADLLERPLELVGREVRVGGFEADLQLRVVGEETQVLVENQYGPSDHDHLGKLLTYGAGLGATLFVWLAETIREEHRAALAWLNEATREDVGFFGVELGFVRIAGSPPAPRLRVVAQPNGWQKRVREAARAPEARPWTEEELVRKGFWDEVVAAALPGLPDPSRWRVTPRPRNGYVWFTPPEGRDYWFTTYTARGGRFGVFCRFKGEAGLAVFSAVRAPAAEAGYGVQLDGSGTTATVGRETRGAWRDPAERAGLTAWFRDELRALAALVRDGGLVGEGPLAA